MVFSKTSLYIEGNKCAISDDGYETVHIDKLSNEDKIKLLNWLQSNVQLNGMNNQREEDKKLVESFLLMVSDPVKALEYSRGRLHDVYQQMVDELNADEKAKQVFMRMNGYMMEAAELYFNFNIYEGDDGGEQ